jgi:hypothetical protein
MNPTDTEIEKQMDHPWMGGAILPNPVLADPPQRRQQRQITQLCGSAEGVFALCNDGTIWRLLGEVWFPEPGIPQRQVMEP